MKLIFTYLLAIIPFNNHIHAQKQDGEIIFISDTEAPLGIERIYHKTNHNETATRALLSNIIEKHPKAVFVTGDLVAQGSSEKSWKTIDSALVRLHNQNISVHAILGNHELLFNATKGQRNFSKRFQKDNVNQYLVVQDSMAIIMLNSNFKKMNAQDLTYQLKWYDSSLSILDKDLSINTIIVGCHHSPYSNSKTVGSNKSVQQRFVPAFLSSHKAVLFISGHAHIFEHHKIQGKDFLVIGGGGGLHQKSRIGKNTFTIQNNSYHPMFHYIGITKEGNELKITSYELQKDFITVEPKYRFSIPTTEAK